MCEWGLCPPGQPSKRYKKDTWWLVSQGLYPWALALSRRCSGQHEHVALKGGQPTQRTEEQVRAFADLEP